MNVLSKKIRTNVLGLAILGLLTSGSVKAGFLSDAGAFFSTAGDKLSTGATWAAGQLSEPVVHVYSGDVLELSGLQLNDLFNPEVLGKACKEVAFVSRGNLIAALGVPTVAALLLSQRRRGGRLAALVLATALAGTSFAFGHHKTGAGYVAAILLALAKYYRGRRKGSRGHGPDEEDTGKEMEYFVKPHAGEVYQETRADDREGDPSVAPPGIDPFQALNEGFGPAVIGGARSVPDPAQVMCPSGAQDDENGSAIGPLPVQRRQPQPQPQPQSQPAPQPGSIHLVPAGLRQRPQGQATGSGLTALNPGNGFDPAMVADGLPARHTAPAAGRGSGESSECSSGEENLSAASSGGSSDDSFLAEVNGVPLQKINHREEQAREAMFSAE